MAAHAVLLVVIAVLASACGGGGGGSSGDGGSSSSSSSSSPAALTLTIHYKRSNGDYAGWGVHLWNDTSGTAAISAATATTWATPLPFSGTSGGWATVSVPLVAANANLNFLIHNGDAKSPMRDLHVNRSVDGGDIWVVQDTLAAFTSQSDADAAVARLGHQADALSLTAVSATSAASALPANWNTRAQFMEIFVRAYKDSDGDGIGDIKGLISKLDYLKSLGVTGLWLMPVYPSSDHDHGYAVTDYRAIEPAYGSMADFDDLITEAHKRGIGIVLDYVMNHSSAENPLFLDAVSDSANVRRNWYIFNASNPGWNGWSGPSWRPSGTGWYYGVFSDQMPDFNLRNPDVVAYHMDNLRFWLNRGVDGFRFDAVETLFENGSTAWYNQPENHALLKQAQTVIKAYPNRYMVCEAPDHPSDYAATTSCGGAFAFSHGGDIKTTATTGQLNAGLAGYLSAADRTRLPLFISNHDSFAGDRPWPDLSARSDYRIAAAIEILASDTPFALYGEEIGMADNSEGGDAGIRVPMSWDATAPAAGFSTVTPFRALSANYLTNNVAAQDGTAGSLLETYRSLYAVRTAWPVLQSGDLTLKSATGDSSLVFLRQQGGQTAVVVMNLSASPQTIAADTGLASTAFSGIYSTAGGIYTSNSAGKVSLTVPAQGVVILLTP
jgi:maltose alpha-D-glucosyltransferase/alpha-amylase